ncbi:MAG: DUF3372 domain-containing protein [Candidatus Sericytochromatia bacterium]|nr:DUF3372 domain-containing protein [Candidatus Tanganyikabacteria bacterium]
MACGFAAGLVAATPALAATAAEIPLEACDAPGFQQILRPAGPRMDARAVWLDRKFLRWPGAAATGRFRLHYGPGGLQARRGARVSGGAGAIDLAPAQQAPPADLAGRFAYLGAGPLLALHGRDLARVPDLLRMELVLTREAADGTVEDATRPQMAGVLDALYAPAAERAALGALPGSRGTRFALWAPTAHRVAACVYGTGHGRAQFVIPMRRAAASGVWSAVRTADLSGRYYRYAVDASVPGTGLVRNLVTDPYSISLTTDSRRSYLGDLAAPTLKPRGWDRHAAPRTVRAQTDMVVYELHVRDFSRDDRTVSAARRGKYGAFKETRSAGMRHLAALARAGLTDVHVLPVFDFGSVPEQGCVEPRPSGPPAGTAQQALVSRNAARDCFNWGYDPVHFNAPEGSYAGDPADGAVRVREFREMVLALHRAGLRVGMDVVYNHTLASGQAEQSVLDRIVPGYYHRLDPAGEVARSTCCENTAAEHRMMARLMIDSAVHWVRHYKIDSFRFDLMGHHPRNVMERLQAAVNLAAGRHVPIIGEGWNFGEVAGGSRFVQASQLSLGGSGIGTFSDRARDAARGGTPFESGPALRAQQGFLTGLSYDPNEVAATSSPSELPRAADMVRIGLAGTIRTYPLETHEGRTVALEAIDYAGQPAGFASEPGEVVNYVENHDNHTLFDISALKLPQATSTSDRARVQVLGAAMVAFSQGVAYFHAGIDTLRSKSLDRNSYDSGDWFNRHDWSYRDNGFGAGLPPERDNGKDYPVLAPLLADAGIKPAPADIAFARDAFRDLLRIRASSTLFRLRGARDVSRRLRFYNTGSRQVPTVLAGRLDGRGYPGAAFGAVLYFLNVDKVAHRLAILAERDRSWTLHPVHRAPRAADRRAAEARYDPATGTFAVPARTAVVFVSYLPVRALRM